MKIVEVTQGKLTYQIQVPDDQATEVKEANPDNKARTPQNKAGRPRRKKADDGLPADTEA